MPSRTQISLDSELHARARERAAKLGISFAEYVRGLIADDLSGVEHSGEVSEVVGLFDSGGSDVARQRDDAIAAAVVAEWERETGRS